MDIDDDIFEMPPPACYECGSRKIPALYRPFNKLLSEGKTPREAFIILGLGAPRKDCCRRMLITPIKLAQRGTFEDELPETQMERLNISQPVEANTGAALMSMQNPNTTGQTRSFGMMALPPTPSFGGATTPTARVASVGTRVAIVGTGIGGTRVGAIGGTRARQVVPSSSMLASSGLPPFTGISRSTGSTGLPPVTGLPGLPQPSFGQPPSFGESFLSTSPPSALSFRISVNVADPHAETGIVAVATEVGQGEFGQGESGQGGIGGSDEGFGQNAAFVAQMKQQLDPTGRPQFQGTSRIAEGLLRTYKAR